jgi:ElaB/YqjD/DUF883 family membrane-anchored ribosome-binding protein
VVERDHADGVEVVPRDEDDEIARLRGEIALSRRRLGSSLQQIEKRVTAGFDWRHWVRTHPWTSLAAGAVLGYSIAQLGRGRRSRLASAVE